MASTVMQIADKGVDPDFKFFVNRGGGIEERMRHLMQDEKMTNEYLGACLDYIRWGGQTTVMYELGTIGLIKFIRHWMKLNQESLIWNDEPPPENFTLPFIRHDKCPRNKNHTETIKDLKGRIRCAHVSERKLKPNFVYVSEPYSDGLSQSKRITYQEEPPENPLPDDPDDAFDETGDLISIYKEDWEKYQRRLEKFDEEEPTFEVRDYCYAILSDRETILTLEEVLDRLNLGPRKRTVYCNNNQFGSCNRISELDEWEKGLYESVEHCLGHEEENNETVHPFDGWCFAWYVQKWYEQAEGGKAPIFQRIK